MTRYPTGVCFRYIDQDWSIYVFFRPYLEPHACVYVYVPYLFLVSLDSLVYLDALVYLVYLEF